MGWTSKAVKEAKEQENTTGKGDTSVLHFSFKHTMKLPEAFKMFQKWAWKWAKKNKK